MYSAVSYTGNGVLTDFAVPFPYLDQAHILVSVNAASVGFTWVNSGTIRLTSAAPNGQTVMISRNSNRAARLVNFLDTADLTEDVLNRDSNQLMYVIQEALDSATASAYFTADAGGSRVVNVADPIVDTDAATQGWVHNYITGLGLGAGGSDLLPLNNTWMGTNLFNSTVSVKGAVLNGVDVSTTDLLKLSKGLYITNLTNQAAAPGYGLVIDVERTTGYAFQSGINLTSRANGTWAGILYGGQFGAWRTKGTTGISNAAFFAVVQTNSNEAVSPRYCLDLRFMNREDGQTLAGNCPSILAQTGDGTGGNYYNTNSWAMQITGQDRTEGGVTYGAWNRGLRFMPYWGDNAKASTYDAAVAYGEGDYVTSGGRVYINVLACTGVVPTTTANWSDLGPGSTVGAVGIDFASVGATTAGRMLSAIRLRGGMPIHYDSEALTHTYFDPGTGRWNFAVNTADHASRAIRFGITAATGDVYINDERRLCATRSSVSAWRNGIVVASSGAWTPIICNTEERDDRAEYNNSTGIFQPNTPGDYLINVQVETDGGAPSGYRTYAGIFVNGVVKRGCATWTGTGTTDAHLTEIVRLNGTTDYVYMAVYWTGPSPQNIAGTQTATYFQASKIQ